jgi:RNA polymerase sigma factor (sigma-70 family)
MNGGTNLPDDELIEAIQESRQTDRAILYLYRQYSEYVSSFIMHYGGSRQDAEDVFQETVVAFVDITKSGKFKRESSIKTFLSSIARNIWLNELKKRERSDAREKIFESARDEKEMDVSQFITERELKQQLRSLLYKLDESCRKILTLFYYDNLSMKEILAHLPYENEQVVRNKKYKCLQQLTLLVKNDLLVSRQVR